MVKRYKTKGDSVINLIFGLIPIFGGYLVLLWFTNKPLFWSWLGKGFVVTAIFVIAIFVWINIESIFKRNRENNLLSALKQAGLEEYVINFINRFGLEKKKNNWEYRGHSFDWERLKDFRKVLDEKGIKLSENNWNDTLILLRHYIQKKEENVTRLSISTNQKIFADLSPSEFENLLYRLFSAIGYIVQLTGKSGDQGCDLVSTMGKERTIIQAKRYINTSVGNDAVQQAVAAQKIYDCTKSMVVACSDFTPEAFQLAKSWNVELIGKQRLNELLLEYLKESWS